ncbi:MAG: hypothetical protein SGJ05_01540 [bacterium]|nr:hypothetical protein [bacterium]
MASQEFQWTPIPFDVEKQGDDTLLSVAIMVMPKLQDATTDDNKLSEYPDMLDWPSTLNNITVTLEFDSGDAVGPLDYQEFGGPASTEAWKSIFKPTTLVRPYEYRPFTDFKIVTYPVGTVLNSIDKFNQKVLAKYANELPIADAELEANNASSTKNNKPKAKLSPMVEFLRDALPDSDAEGAATEQMQKWESEGRGATNALIKQGGPTKNTKTGSNKERIDVPTAPQSMMFQPIGMSSLGNQLQMVELYHAPRNIPVAGNVGGKDYYRAKRYHTEKPKYDFHQVVSVMREYPEMLRRLGIVKHVKFKMPDGLGSNGKVRCIVNFPGPAVTTKHVTPWTVFRLTTSGDAAFWQFLPRPDGGSEIVGALLCLNDKTNYDIVQIDVDAASLKTLNYARGIMYRITKTIGTKSSKTDATPPSTRGTGLQLIRVNRGLKLAKQIIRSGNNYNKLVTNQEVNLYADDLMRGVRIDVFDETTDKWESLMRRDGLLKFPEASGALKTIGVPITDEEGVLTFAATRPVSANPTSMRDLYAHETVAQWEGWSLVAPRIGSFIGIEDELQPENKTSTPSPDFEYKVETTFSVTPNSLPRLRYGRDYRMRARFTDIAGNSAKKDELKPDDFDCASELIRYYRWDPIISPSLTLRTNPVEGESLERMVIRTFNESEDETVLPPIEKVCERHMFPPLAAQQLAERHGMFDDPITKAMNGDSSTYDLIVNKSKDLPFQWYKRNGAGGLDPMGALNAVPSASSQKDAIRYPIVAEAVPETPYLPDPMARGFTLQNVPGMAANEGMEIKLAGGTQSMIIASPSGGVVTIPFDPFNLWPAIHSIIVQLAEGTSSPMWQPGARTLILSLPKGEQATIKFSSNMGETKAEAEEVSKVHGNIGTLTKAGVSGPAFDAALRGLSWMLTPGRTLHLVHATQKPLKKPEIKIASVYERVFGGTNAGIDFKNVYYHSHTTSKVDIHGEWKMWQDNLNEEGPVLLDQRKTVVKLQDENPTDDKLSAQHLDEFGDTKYRLMNYVPTATTLFKEYMPPDRKDTTAKLTRRGPEKELHILSTKRPDPVDLLYVVPSFKWVEEKKELVGGVIESTRRGGGLRVYMKRPWYSSGNGELLGVILYSTKKFVPQKPDSGKDSKGSKDIKNYNSMPYVEQLTANADIKGSVPGIMAGIGVMGDLVAGGQLNIPEELHPYVTEWGLDPIWLSAPTPADAAPRINNFVDPKVVLDNISIDEVDPKQRFAVVGFEPQYDEKRKLWYCDIEIDPGKSYFPFIRMALCRLQPHSLADSTTGHDVFVSRIALSDFCQIAPDRKATARIEDDKNGVTVQVVGHTYRMNTTGHQGSEIEVTIEKRDSSAPGAGLPGDLGWTPVITQRIDRIQGANMWAGYVAVKNGVTSNQHRVVIKEYEQLFSDPADERLRETSLGNKTTGDGDITLTLERRIVYADVLNLF